MAEIKPIEELLKIQAKSDEMRDHTVTKKNFNAWFNKKMELEQPIRDWAFNEFRKVCAEKSINDLDQLHTWVLNQDLNCETIPEDIFGVFKEDDTIKVSVVLNYDCDTTLCKFWIWDKVSGLKYRDAINLGEKYLSQAKYTFAIK
jgi:hypothetical protein